MSSAVIQCTTVPILIVCVLVSFFMRPYICKSRTCSSVREILVCPQEVSRRFTAYSVYLILVEGILHQGP